MNNKQLNYTQEFPKNLHIYLNDQQSVSVSPNLNYQSKTNLKANSPRHKSIKKSNKMTVTQFFEKIEQNHIAKPNILINQKPLIVRKNKEKN